jgi:hypothetical protein
MHLNSHCNRESDVIIIPSIMGTCQGGPLWGALLILEPYVLELVISPLVHFHPLQIILTS